MLEFVKHFFKMQFLLIVLAVGAGIYYPQIIERLKNAALGQGSEEEIAVHFSESGTTETTTLFTKEQLSTFNGEDGAPLYLALLGTVYDVSKGAKHYGSGCSYNFFVGRDASVSFITGDFDDYVEGQADDVVSLKPNELLSLENWKKFYDKDYVYKGKLIGRFYDATGTSTTYHHKYLALLEQAQEAKAASDELLTLYPDCNIEWSAETGTRVWCSTSSGGKDRPWVGHPRKLFTVGSENFRCACIRKEQLDTTAIMLKPYENCERLANECFYKV